MPLCSAPMATRASSAAADTLNATGAPAKPAIPESAASPTSGPDCTNSAALCAIPLTTLRPWRLVCARTEDVVHSPLPAVRTTMRTTAASTPVPLHPVPARKMTVHRMRWSCVRRTVKSSKRNPVDHPPVIPPLPQPPVLTSRNDRSRSHPASLTSPRPEPTGTTWARSSHMIGRTSPGHAGPTREVYPPPPDFRLACGEGRIWRACGARWKDVN